MREDELHFERELPAEGAALPGDAPAPDTVALSPLAALFTAHMIPDGEIVLLLIKPSLWFIPLTAAFPLGFAAVLALVPRLVALPGAPSAYLNGAILLAAVSLMWATVQWMGRYYVLTDMRVMAMSGVFQTSIQQCLLRKVARVRMLRTFRDRLLGLGSIEVIPQQEESPIVFWATVGRPKMVKDRVQQAVGRAKGTGRGV